MRDTVLVACESLRREINAVLERTGVMLANYRYLGLLDTGGYRIEELAEDAGQMARELGLEKVTIPATTDYIRALITGARDSPHYLSVAPHARSESLFAEVARIPRARGSP